MLILLNTWQIAFFTFLYLFQAVVRFEGLIIYCIYIVEEHTAEMSKYSKNFLPIMFNVYTADGVNNDEPGHQVVLDTVRDYLQISEQEVGASA